jgi:hypothetical protein
MPGLFSIVATYRSHLFESICRQRISVSRLSQAKVLGEGFSEVGHFADCSTGRKEGVSHDEMQVGDSLTARINQRRRVQRSACLVPLCHSRNLEFQRNPAPVRSMLASSQSFGARESRLPFHL